LKISKNADLAEKYKNYKTAFVVGQVVTFPAFTSVSVDDAVAEEFGDRMLFQFVRVRGARIRVLSDVPNEAEVLVPPPSVFRIVAVAKFKSSVIVTLEMMESILTYLKTSDPQAAHGTSHGGLASITSGLTSVVMSHGPVLDPELESLAKELVHLKIGTSTSCAKFAQALGDHGVMSLADFQKLDSAKAKSLMAQVGMKDLQVIKITESFCSPVYTPAPSASLGPWPGELVEGVSGPSEVLDEDCSMTPLVVWVSYTAMYMGFAGEDSFRNRFEFKPVAFDDAVIDAGMYTKLFSDMGVDQNMHRVLLVLPSDTSALQVRDVARLFFDALQVPELSAIPASVALYSRGSTTGVVLEVGRDATVATVIVGAAHGKPCVSKVGGAYFGSKDVSMVNNEDLQVFFTPERFGLHCIGIHRLLCDVLAQAPASCRKDLLSHVFLRVPVSLFPKFCSLFMRELGNVLPAGELSQLKIRHSHLSDPWVSGSLLTSLPCWEECWISRSQHESQDAAASFPLFATSIRSGELIDVNGHVYKGELKDGKRNGRGKYTWPSGQVYEGEWKDGERNGRGKQMHTDGEVYEGEWKDAKENGRGKNTWPSGEVYEGEWKDGERNGRGKIMYTDGEVYEGEWKDDKKNGRGKYTWPSGQVYEGEWKDGKENGRGKYTWPSGQVYEGEFKDGLRNGRGKIMYTDGEVYEGEWKDDKKNGRGKHTWPSGEVYEGEFKVDTYHGRGKMTYPTSGYVYEGEWRDDNYHGHGTLTRPGGSCQIGTWQDGIFVGSSAHPPSSAATSATAVQSMQPRYAVDK
jgi:hypothetical protein